MVHADNRHGIKHLLYKPSTPLQTYLHIVLLDTSGSMLTKQGLSQAKGVLQYFCEKLYQERDLLTVVSFGNQQVDIIYNAKPVPKSVDSILRSINGGGGTPLNQALLKVKEISLKHKKQPQTLTILTDGRVQKVSSPPSLTMPITLVDMERAAINVNRVATLAKQLTAEYIHLEQLATV